MKRILPMVPGALFVLTIIVLAVLAQCGGA